MKRPAAKRPAKQLDIVTAMNTIFAGLYDGESWDTTARRKYASSFLIRVFRFLAVMSSLPFFQGYRLARRVTNFHSPCVCIEGLCNFASVRRRKLTCGHSLLRRLVHHPAPGTSSFETVSPLDCVGHWLLRIANSADAFFEYRSYFSVAASSRAFLISSAIERRRATASAQYRPCLNALLPFGGPSDRPPCIRQRPFGIAGDWQGFPLLVRAPQRLLRFMGELLCMGLILRLGAARPLRPSADSGPGGQSFGQAAQFY